MARVLRNFRYRSLQETLFPENLSYVALLDSILALDDELYKFPDSSVPSLQTLCIKCIVRRSSALCRPYTTYSDEQLLSVLPPGPFDGLPPPLCDLLCDLLLSLRDPESTVTPLYCLISPYTRCLGLREPLTQVAAVALEALLAARVRHLAELTWTGAPLRQRLLDYLIRLPSLTALITDEPVDAVNVRELLRGCPALRALQLRDCGCVATLADQGVVGHQLRDLRLLKDRDESLNPVAVSTVFPRLEKLSVQPVKPEDQWCFDEVDLGFPVSEPFLDSLKELSLKGCDYCEIFERPLKALTKLTLENCMYPVEYIRNQQCLNFFSSICCSTRLGRCSPGPRQVVNADTLHLDIDFDLLGPFLVDNALTLAVFQSIFPHVRRLALAGDVHMMSAVKEFEDLCELYYSFESSVIAEQILATLPLSRLERLSLNYKTDDDTPLALETLSPCSRLLELELEGFSDLSVPRGLQLPSVRRVRLRGGACRPRVVQGLIGALPGLQCLQLVELTIRSDLWTPWFREWRQIGIDVELEGGCSVPSWRRSSIRSHTPAQ